MGLTALSLVCFILFILRTTSDFTLYNQGYDGYLYFYYPVLILLAFEPLLLGIYFSQISQNRKYAFSVFMVGLLSALLYDAFWAAYLVSYYMQNTSSYCDVACGIDAIFLLPILVILLPTTLIAVSNNRSATERNSLANFCLFLCAGLYTLISGMFIWLGISFFI